MGFGAGAGSGNAGNPFKSLDRGKPFGGGGSDQGSFGPTAEPREGYGKPPIRSGGSPVPSKNQMPFLSRRQRMDGVYQDQFKKGMSRSSQRGVRS